MSGTLALEVESIAVGGDGVAREPGGRVVFLPRTAPGDRVEARLVEEHDSWARGRPVRIEREGPGRRAPDCPHYEACGGCQLQHLERDAHLEAKRRAVRDALERIGGRAVEVRPVADPGPPFGYRNRVALTLRREERGVVAGYHRWDEPGQLVDVERCPLAEEAVDRAWRELRDAWGSRAERLPAGDELRLTVRAGGTGEVGVLIEGGRGAGRPGELAEGLSALACLWHRPEGGDVRVLHGSATLPERWQGVELALRPDTFTQVNRTVAAAMERHVDELLGLLAGRRVLDLYAGVGLRALRWAEAGAEAVACERDPGAVRAGRDAAEARGTALEHRTGSVEDHLADLLPADAAVVNPPRAGLSEAVTSVLDPGSLGTLVYVSCDPATLARDLKRLGDRWIVTSVQPFDAFPQTAHVETVVRLEAS